jgi:hypothetical protein
MCLLCRYILTAWGVVSRCVMPARNLGPPACLCGACLASNIFALSAKIEKREKIIFGMDALIWDRRATIAFEGFANHQDEHMPRHVPKGPCDVSSHLRAMNIHHASNSLWDAIVLGQRYHQPHDRPSGLPLVISATCTFFSVLNPKSVSTVTHVCTLFCSTDAAQKQHPSSTQS